MRRSGRRREHFDIHGGGFVCTGPNEAAVRAAMDWARSRVAFYASTRTYRPILALHGLEDLGLKLHQLSVERRWQEMPQHITDDTLHLFAACGTYRDIVRNIQQRFGGAADAIEIFLSPDCDMETIRELIADIHRIPHAFRGFATGW
jgi:hypothetical protein